MASRKELSHNEMLQYLKTVMELEVSVYTQAEVLEKAEDAIYEPRKQKVEKEEIRVHYPSKPIKEYVNNDHKIALGIGIGCIGFGLILSIMSAAPYLQLFLYLVGAVALLLAPTGFRAEKAAQEQYLSDLKKYEAEMAETKAKHEALVAAAETDYQKRMAAAEEEYTRQLNNYHAALPTLEQMREQLDATENILQDMYSLDILYTKYQELIPVSTFYEYFATERVTKLTGSNGAYNLYEQELRMDLVINKLDVIIDELEDIKDNQYTLYRELVTANKTLKTISANLTELIKSAHRTEKLASITAYCAQVTAQNTEALKYLALIS